MDEDRTRLGEQDLRAWKALRLMSRQIDAQLARRLAVTSELSMQDYDVLSSVAPLPRRRAALKDLMLHLQWSYSRLSHHLTRMEKRGLVRRISDPSRAGVEVEVTDEGFAEIRGATGDHLRAVRELVADALEPGEAEMLERLSGRILDRLPGPTPTRGW